ncbi:hypothetical protein [Hyphomicrobium sp. 99]|uniref:hypothetical protein n=1 Tax=Hyphomicrobium sp. 99 TaxID=1163419 RepID=UPI0012E04265|nr:hypothetical protein [Hyphomicrobium sp. 99]
MKTIAIAVAACGIIAGGVAAAPAGIIQPKNISIVHLTHGRGGGWGPNTGVIVDVPWEAMGYNNPPAPNPDANRCREARHACFDQWGTDGRRYGLCMQRAGC